MPFIWDDMDYSMVNKQKNYDENRFVIVRKLYVTLNKSSNKASISSISLKPLRLFFALTMLNIYSMKAVSTK